MIINQRLKKLERDINAYNPIENDLTDDELLEIIKSYEGIDNFHTNKINFVINNCITNKNKKPLDILLKYTNACINDINECIEKFINKILQMQKIDTYPISTNKYNINISEYGNLICFLKDGLYKYLNIYKKQTAKIVEDQMRIHELNSISTINYELDNNIIYFFPKREIEKIDNLASMVNENINTDVIMSSDAVSYNISAYRNTINKIFKKISLNFLDIANKTISVSYLSSIQFSLNCDLLDELKYLENLNEIFSNPNIDLNKIKNLEIINSKIDNLKTKLH
jgi:hypothetical protein